MHKSEWVWMPHPAHFIGARDCKFHLATCVGKYIVSTVGEYWPDSQARKIHAEVRKIIIPGIGDAWDANYFKKFGWMEIGLDRTYETMVFRAVLRQDDDAKCCPFKIDVSREVAFDGYNDAGSAKAGHYALCLEWSKK